MSVPTEATCQVCTERVTGEQIAYYNPKKWVVMCKRCVANHPVMKTSIYSVEAPTWK
jgi:hypothetical protein